MKYSGSLFLCTRNDTKLLEKFLATSGLKKAEEKKISRQPLQTPSTGMILLNNFSSRKSTTRVDKIEIEQIRFINDEFLYKQSAELVRKDTQIKITFKNDSISLTEEEKQTIKNAKGNDFIFDVDINYGSIIASNEWVQMKKRHIIK